MEGMEKESRTGGGSTFTKREGEQIWRGRK